MNLYEIDREIEECFIVDSETGEVIDFDSERFNKLEYQKAEAVDNLAKLYKNLISDANALKSEKDSFAKRERAAKSRADGIKRYLEYSLGGENFKSTQAIISYRKSEAVVVDDIDKVDKKFLKYAEPTVDKTAVKQAIRAGEELCGVHLENKKNIQIK